MVVARGVSALILACVVSSISAPAQNATAQASPSAPAPTARKVLLKAGTEVPLKFAQTVHSRVSKPGATIELALAEDLKVSDAVVVKKGARALGSVTRTNNPNSLGRGGELYLQIEYLKVGGSLIKLRGESGGRGAKSHINPGVVLAAGAIGLFVELGKPGKQYVIAEGTPITAYVAEDIELPLVAVCLSDKR